MYKFRNDDGRHLNQFLNLVLAETTCLSQLSATHFRLKVGPLARMEAIGWAVLSAILCLVLAVLLYLKQVFSQSESDQYIVWYSGWWRWRSWSRGRT